jgi:excisionase family DNA binding protein
MNRTEPTYALPGLFEQTPNLPLRRPKTDIPFLQRPTCTIREACQAAGLGRTKLYELIKSGTLKTTTIGRRRLVLVPSLLKAIRFQEDVVL